ncbi:bi-domain-containing oxidoreductase [Albibacterium sp.]|uniref:bi-domain-containing oxidoreductase n=1 Tax=Albibacterium sp. TaxID=2952885 RepID=UPI002C97A877|nr:bi-domain-containing oxidoreductase [Albibacterium sp.]HUH18941.1 bi-domain-containing oxidoreductase [Albibacterium sp.]
MKQIIQSFKTGETILEDIPTPQVSNGCVLIKTTRSLVSLGTERMLVEFGKSNLISKARQQPDKVKQVLDKIKTEGLMPTLEAVFNKLGEPLPLGYCNVGRVVAVGTGVSEFNVGDRVASNGAHAEYVNIPKNLVAYIPENVSDEEAAFTVVGSIGLQGIRLCNPTFGETIVVIGLGLIGLLTAELLAANGCRVIGVDLDSRKLELARAKGIIGINPREGEDVIKTVLGLTNNTGADGVIITASAKNNEIISQAAQMSRKRGRIVLVGVIGLDISRADFYEKELSFQVSCSYGPGRYDEDYERKGNDYPLPYVRWTEKRNFEAVLQAISSGKLEVKSLITERTALSDYKDIYANISNQSSIASILEYPIESDSSNTILVNTTNFEKGKGGIGIIGAGNFTKMTMLPVLKAANANLVSIASAGGLTGTSLAKKYGIAKSTTDFQEILKDDAVDLILITTRHNQHANMVSEGLLKGKNVFVEKPLALNESELEEIIQAYNGSKTLTVGFNRRFSPHIQKIKQLVGNTPMNVIATMNAGHIPANVWVHDMKIGGGRIIGEACHFIDLITFLTGSKVKAVCMNAMGLNPQENTDNASILLEYENGSTGVINYFSNGSKAYSKERVEVYSQERIAIMDNFRVTTGYGFKGFSKLKTRLDKGHKEQFKLLVERTINGGDALIPFDEIINTTKASFAAIESLKERKWITL